MTWPSSRPSGIEIDGAVGPRRHHTTPPERRQAIAIGHDAAVAACGRLEIERHRDFARIM